VLGQAPWAPEKPAAIGRSRGGLSTSQHQAEPMRSFPSTADNLWICGQRQRVDHIPAGPSSTAIKGFNRIGKEAINSSRMGTGNWNQRESLLTHPDSCPTNGKLHRLCCPLMARRIRRIATNHWCLRCGWQARRFCPGARPSKRACTCSGAVEAIVQDACLDSGRHGV
jgi:hypothetical protein